MSDFGNQVTSLSWWLGVVVVGILINILAAYIKPKFDVFLGYISQNIRDKNEEKRKLWDEKVKRLAEDYNYRLIYYSKINYDFLECLFLIVTGIGIYVGLAAVSEVPPSSYHLVSTRYVQIFVLLSYALGALCIALGTFMYLKINWRSIKLSEAEKINGENYR